MLLFSVLAGCDDNPSSKTEGPRDLSTALSFAELIDRRMANDITLDDSIVLINTEVQASFNQPVACANPLPCTDDIYNTNIVDPIYQGSNFECTGNWFRLIDGSHKERLLIDLQEHTEFYILTEFDSKVVNFYAQVEFVERQAWCSDQVNYGLKIRLLDGEESHLLEQYL